MKKTTKKSDKCIELLNDLVDQLYFFYGNRNKEFKDNVIKPATIIENTLRELAVNKKTTFKQIAERYEKIYKQKQKKVIDIITDLDDTKLNQSVSERYRRITEED